MTVSATKKWQDLAGEGVARTVWLGLPSPAICRIATEAGFRFGVIDREHGTIGIESAAEMIMTLKAAGARAMVRVPDCAAGEIKHALDAGADGIVVPYVETAAEAEAALEAFAFPPLGKRGFATPVIAATGYGSDTTYGATWNDRGILAVQIESRKALGNARAIAAVNGVDMLFFGPFDYAQDAGLDSATVGAALMSVFREIVAAAKAEGKLAGVFPWPGTTVPKLAEAGASLIAAASDVVTLRNGFANALTAAKG